MHGIPELATSRLLLRGWTEDDVAPWGRICGDAETMRFIGDGTPMPPDRAWHAVAFVLGHWALRGFGMWAVTERDTGVLLGRVGLYEPEGWPGTELGWLIDRARWGQGFATEAAEAAAGWAFDTLRAPHLISLIQPGNIASIRVAAKLGARLDRRIDMDGTDVDVYALAAAP